MDLSLRCLHAPPDVLARSKIVRRIPMTECRAPGVAAESHRRNFHRGAAGSPDVPYTESWYPSFQTPGMSDGEQCPFGIVELRTSERGNGGAQSCVARTASSH